MDNITHTLVGAALAQTGLKKWTPRATTALVLGANLPDVDIVTGLFGTLPYLEYHRGITHALAALPLLAAALAAALYLSARWRNKHSVGEGGNARFGPLFAVSLISILTHPLLDFTNSYGWRPFLPWSNHWYYGDTAFVIDPWIWLLLGVALCWVTATTRARLIAWAVFFAVLAVPLFLFQGASPSLKLMWALVAASLLLCRALPKTSAAGTGAVAALCILFAYLGSRLWIHRLILDQLNASAMRVTGAERIQQINALPLPLTPLQWQAAIVTDQAYYITEHHLSTPFPASRVARYARESGDASTIAAARQTREIQAFLRFARFPIFEVRPTSNQATEVIVSDARFFDVNRQARSTFRLRILLDQNLQQIVEKRAD